MIYGYIRVSTKSQEDNNSLEIQREAVTSNGAVEIFEDVASGKDFNREGFKALDNVLKDGDTLVITKLDRFSRDTQLARGKMEELLNNGIKVHILNMGLIDLSTPVGRLTFNILCSFAEYERDCIIERMREGKAKAKQSADFREGRPITHKTKAKDHALELLKIHSIKEVVEMTGISKATLMRHKAKRKSEALEGQI